MSSVLCSSTTQRPVAVREHARARSEWRGAHLSLHAAPCRRTPPTSGAATLNGGVRKLTRRRLVRQTRAGKSGTTSLRAGAGGDRAAACLGGVRPFRHAREPRGEHCSSNVSDVRECQRTRADFAYLADSQSGSADSGRRPDDVPNDAARAVVARLCGAGRHAGTRVSSWIESRLVRAVVWSPAAQIRAAATNMTVWPDFEMCADRHEIAGEPSHESRELRRRDCEGTAGGDEPRRGVLCWHP